MRELTIIIPVYRGIEETKKSILSIVDNLPNWAKLLVINDCSPESELTDWLRDNSKQKGYTLHENKANLGFTETVNKGMKISKNDDILLLNSDVESANSDWLQRIRYAAYSKKNLATITPFSNNATICSFPNFCEDNDLFESLDVTQIDSIFKNLKLDQYLVEIPTGIGFCMFIKRECLNDIGYFNVEVFGKGYGEENDWCQRAYKAGWKNYHQLDIFSYHRGGVSFANEQNPRKEKALKILNDLHPKYQSEVMSFINLDPAKAVRMQAVLTFISNSNKYKILNVSHKLGGGVATHIKELSNYYTNKIISILIKPIINNTIELSFRSLNVNQSLRFNLDTNYNDFIDILKLLNIDRFHFHHMMDMPSCIITIPRILNCNYDVTIHDYHYLNGNPTLTDKNGRYFGKISSTENEKRNSYNTLFENANRVIFPSFDAHKRYSNYYNFNNAIIAWHPDSEGLESLEHPNRSLPKHSDRAAALKILVLGALSKEKGAEILEKVASKLNKENIYFHLLGYSFKPLANVITHGAYDNDQIDALIDEISPDVIWFPALCPETYSYTLSAAIRSSAFIVAPDLGAFPERLFNHKHNCIVSWSYSITEWSYFWISLFKGNIISLKNTHSYSTNNNFYRDQYLSYEKNKKITHDFQTKTLLPFINRSNDDQLGKREKTILLLVKLKNNKLFSWLIAYIPFNLQRKIKRVLSRKPIHEIINNDKAKKQ